MNLDPTLKRVMTNQELKLKVKNMRLNTFLTDHNWESIFRRHEQVAHQEVAQEDSQGSEEGVFKHFWLSIFIFRDEF